MCSYSIKAYTSLEAKIYILTKKEGDAIKPSFRITNHNFSSAQQM